MKPLPTLRMRQACQCGRKQLRPGKIQIFLSKYLQIKEKILVNFSVASQNG